MPTGESTTRFGAAWFPVERSAAVLRARALRFGLTLPDAPPPRTHSAAAVAAVEAWMTALDAVTLEHPARYGAPAVSALASSLTLLSGETPGWSEPPPPSRTPPPLWFGCVDQLSDWCGELALPTAEVLALAAAALTDGAGDTRLDAMAFLLRTAARQHGLR